MKLYRFDDRVYAPLDEGSPIGNIPTIVESHYEVIKETSKGWWIDYAFRKRWVSKIAKKHFACATREEAWKSFKARKARQMTIYKAKLERATFAYNSFIPQN